MPPAPSLAPGREPGRGHPAAARLDHPIRLQESLLEMMTHSPRVRLQYWDERQQEGHGRRRPAL